MIKVRPMLVMKTKHSGQSLDRSLSWRNDMQPILIPKGVAMLVIPIFPPFQT